MAIGDRVSVFGTTAEMPYKYCVYEHITEKQVNKQRLSCLLYNYTPENVTAPHHHMQDEYIQRVCTNREDVECIYT